MIGELVCEPVPRLLFVWITLEGDHTKLVCGLYAFSQEFHGKTRVDCTCQAIDMEVVRETNDHAVGAGLEDTSVSIGFNCLSIGNPLTKTHNSLLVDKFESLLGDTIVLLIPCVAVGSTWALREMFPEIIEVLALDSSRDDFIKSSGHSCELVPELG